MAGISRLPATEFISLLQSGRRIVGVSVTPHSHEVASMGPPFTQGYMLSTGGLLSPRDLKMLVDQQAAGVMIVGGTALLKADGSTHFGVRKLISEVIGLSYDNGDWLPSARPARRNTAPVMTLLCREGLDNPITMLQHFVQRHAGNLKTTTAWERQSWSEGR